MGINTGRFNQECVMRDWTASADVDDDDDDNNNKNNNKNNFI